MAPRKISSEAQRFITERIPSAGALEVLMLLHRSPHEWWSAEKAASALHTSADSAAVELERLGAGGLLDIRLAHELLYKYAPVTPDLARAANETAVAFEDQRLAVFDLISSRPSLQAAREFADAFKVWSDEDG